MALSALLDQKRGPEDLLHLSPATKLPKDIWAEQCPSLRVAEERKSLRKPRHSSGPSIAQMMGSPHGTSRALIGASPQANSTSDVEDEKSPSEADRSGDSSAESLLTPSTRHELRATAQDSRGSLDKLSRLTHVSGMFAMKRSASTTSDAREAVVGEDALRMFESMPQDLHLGLAIVTNPKALGAVEAMWDMRIVAQNRGIRLMERPWFILSPTNWKLQCV